MDKKQFLSTEKRAQIVLLNNLKFSVRQIARKMKGLELAALTLTLTLT